MKKILIVLTFLFGLCLNAQVNQKNTHQKNKSEHKENKITYKVPEYNPAMDYQSKAKELAERITEQDLSKHLHIIAADSMQGRETGKPGQKMAANYISGSFFYSGLQPVVPTKDAGGPSYYQPFFLIKRSWGKVEIQTAETKYEYLKDFYITGNTGMSGQFETDVTFVGYGIETDKYSDYKDKDVTGKAVLILAGEPKNKKGIYFSTGTSEGIDWANNWRKKASLARTKGAKIIFAIQDEKDFNSFINQSSTYLKNGVLTYENGTPAIENGIFYIKGMDALKNIFKIKSRKIKKEIKRISNGKKAKIPDHSVKIFSERKIDTVKTENVLGYVEGSDKKDELIIISSHYDHIGVNPDGQINNGADDDGSGTSAVLELADAFGVGKSLGYGPRRSILFLTVTGEEKGLLGSRYYTENPVFLLSNTVCDLNIDMIGRLDDTHINNPDYVYLIGSDKLSSQLHNVSEEANKKFSNLSLDYRYNDENDPNRFYYRSDHYNFAKNGIPVIFYFNGVHEDYHKPTDDVEKINFKKMEKITRLVFYTAWEIANREERIKVDSNKK